MENDLIAQMIKLELLVFFSGYALIFTLISLLTDIKSIQSTSLIVSLYRLLPLSYALVGALFLGFILKERYQNVQINQALKFYDLSSLQIVGLLSLLFFIPVFRKLPILSLVHSLIFLFLILKDLILYFKKVTHIEVIRNDLNILLISILLNVCTLAVVYLLLIFRNRMLYNMRNGQVLKN